MFLDNTNSIYNSIDKKIYFRLKEKEKIMIDAVEGSDIRFVDSNYYDDVFEILDLKSRSWVRRLYGI